MNEARSTNIANIHPNPRNARTHSKKQIRQIADSIERFGWTFPILTDENGSIIAGHGRYHAARLLGLRKVPSMTMLGLSDTAKRALALADNKIAANAGWDRAALAAELGELKILLPQCSMDIDITGFEPAEIDSLFGDLSDPDLDPADEVPAPYKDAVTLVDDLWELNNHRLLCGNAKSTNDVGRLMDGERAAMIFTDPPYNVRIASVQGRGKTRHREFAEASGELSPNQFTRFLIDGLSPAAKHSAAGSVHFVCIDWRHLGELLAAGKVVYDEPKNVIAWVKSNAGMGTFYRSQHELIFVFKIDGAPHINNFELGQHGRHRSNVWQYAGVDTFRPDRVDGLSAHPTIKPVAMVADAMRDCSRRGDIVLDPFMGSGTSILAAERVGRRGYGLEIDPQYVDAAVRRWQNYTKRDAILKGTGQTFDEVTAERTPRIRRSK